jgi:competence protein ComEC
VRHPGVGESVPTRVDVRLIPAALTSWVVTAAGIAWPVGRVLASCCVVLVAVTRRAGLAALRGYR